MKKDRQVKLKKVKQSLYNKYNAIPNTYYDYIENLGRKNNL